MNNNKFVRLTALTLLFILLNINSFAQEIFSGEVKMNMTDETGKVFSMNYFVKENLIRFSSDMQGQNVGIIFNTEKNIMLMIMEEQKMYMEMPMDMINKQMDIEENNVETENKFTATGETKEIIGYLCEKWIYEDEESVAEVWMTKDIGQFKFFEGGFGNNKKSSSWESSIEKSGSFPILVINRDKEGKELNKLEVISVTPKSLDENLFTVPEGFQKFNMPNMN